jgi:hypothetical protein
MTNVWQSTWSARRGTRRRAFPARKCSTQTDVSTRITQQDSPHMHEYASRELIGQAASCGGVGRGKETVTRPSP